ncbi:MAG: 4-hydroxy-tetrahydrodipicolinate synthase [Pseudomonadota bacterium]
MKTQILWTALATPMLENGSIDFNSLTVLVNRQVQAGNGILLLGSTGEGLALSTEEKRQVVDHVCSLQLKADLMVGVGGFQLNKQLEWLSFCESKAVDAYLMPTPIYAKPEAKGQQAWFETLLENVTRPCMLYNVPSRTGVTLATEALTTLVQHPNCWALKEASGQLAQFETYQKAAPSLALYSGEDAMISTLTQHGAKGLVSVVANLWPQEARHYVENCLANCTSATEKKIWQQASNACFTVSNPIPTKVWLHRQSFIKSPQLRLPLVSEALTDTTALQQAEQTIKSYYQEQTT